MKSDWRFELLPKMLSSNCSVRLNDGIKYQPAWAHAGECVKPRHTVRAIAAERSLTGTTSAALYHTFFTARSTWRRFDHRPSLKAPPGLGHVVGHLALEDVHGRELHLGADSGKE